MFERLATQMVLADVLGEVLVNEQAYEYFLYNISLGLSISSSLSSTLDYCDQNDCFGNEDDEDDEDPNGNGGEGGENEENGEPEEPLTEVELSLYITNLPTFVGTPSSITEGYRNPDNFADVVCENGNISMNFWTEQELDKDSENNNLYFYTYGSGNVYEDDKCMLITTKQPMQPFEWPNPYSLYIGAAYDSGVNHFDLISTLAIARANELSHYEILDTKLESYSQPIDLFGTTDINEFVQSIIPSESDYMQQENNVISQIPDIWLYDDYKTDFDNWLNLRFMLFGGKLKFSYPEVHHRARDNFNIMMSLGAPYDARHIKMLVEEYAASGDLVQATEAVRNAEF